MFIHGLNVKATCQHLSMRGVQTAYASPRTGAKTTDIAYKYIPIQRMNVKSTYTDLYVNLNTIMDV